MKNLIKIAPEGYSIILVVSLLCLFSYCASIFFNYSWISLLSLYLFYFLLITFYFFRDPIRKIISNDDFFLSPADGRIVDIKSIEDSELGKSTKISIFLSFFNVHRQWAPINATVIQTSYNPGKFFGAFKNKASEKNEQTSILFCDEHKNQFKIKQIAGFVARRIVNHMNPNLDVLKGEKIGFIKFGSRVDIIVPENFKVKVKKGMKVKGCKTVIGTYL